MEGLEIYLLVDWTASETEVKTLVVSVFHRFHHLLRHPHSEGQIASHLPHHNGGANVLGLDLYVLARDFLCNLQAVGPVLVATIFGSISEGSREFVHLRLVDFLFHTFLEALEDDGELYKKEIVGKDEMKEDTVTQRDKDAKF
uniref:Uncharacterized protein n=1 Tax=Anolis carolinensis TaxID=28377 RepID=A0A803T8U5_ANOCA